MGTVLLIPVSTSIGYPYFRFILSRTPDLNPVWGNFKYTIVWIVGFLEDRLQPVLPEIMTRFAGSIQLRFSLNLEIGGHMFRISNATGKMDFGIMLDLFYFSSLRKRSKPDL